MTKRLASLLIFAFALFLFTLQSHAQSTNRTSINRGFLQSNFDLNGFVMTNGTISNATYYGNGAGITNLTAPSALGNATAMSLTASNGIIDLSPTTNRIAFFGNGGVVTNGNLLAGASTTITTNNLSVTIAVTTNVYVLRNETGGQTNTGTAAFATLSANTFTATNGIIDAGPTTNRPAYIGFGGVLTNGAETAGSAITITTNNNGVTIAVTSNIFLLAANNLSDVTAATARVNLGINTNLYLPVTNGNASNVTIFGTVDGFNTPALIIHPPTNNINVAAINIYGHSTNAASIINYQNDTSHAAADLGLWGQSFGKPYGGNFALDLYDYLGLGSNNVFGPGYVIAPTGKYLAMLGDSGVVSHPLFRVSSTNLTVEFTRALADDREGVRAGYFDGSTGYFKNWTNEMSSSKPPAGFTGTGTVSTSGSSTNITGSGTLFTTEVSLGAKLYNGGTLLGYVNKITDNTNLSVALATTISSTAYTVQNPSHRFTSLGVPFAVLDSDGCIFMQGDTVNPSLRFSAGGKSGGFGWSAANFGFFLDSGGIPFLIASTAANNSLNVDAFSTVNATYAFASPAVTATTVTSTNVVVTATNGLKAAVGSLIQTNFISGLLYTNLSSTIIHVSAHTALVTTGVAGNSAMELRCSGYLTNTNNMVTSLTLTPAATNTYNIDMWIPAGNTWVFTNTSTGAGDSSSVVGGQILIH